jgi:hypothetical protein
MKYSNTSIFCGSLFCPAEAGFKINHNWRPDMGFRNAGTLELNL